MSWIILLIFLVLLILAAPSLAGLALTILLMTLALYWFLLSFRPSQGPGMSGRRGSQQKHTRLEHYLEARGRSTTA